MAILAAINLRCLMQGAVLCKTSLAGHWCLNTTIPLLLLLPSSYVPAHSFSSQIILEMILFFSAGFCCLFVFFFLSSESYEKKEELGCVMRGTWTSRLFLLPLPVQLAMATSLGPGTANTGLGYAWQLLHPLFKNTKKRENVLAVNFS